MIEFLLRAVELKDERRTGWVVRGVENPESVAAHTWGVSLLCLCYGPEADVDVDRAIRLAIVHDIAEVETGDIAMRAVDAEQEQSRAGKERLEADAMEVLDSVVDGDEIRSLWEEYEDRETPEAVFVKDMDVVEMCLQVVAYERDQRYESEGDLDEFFVTAEPQIQTAVGRRLYEDIRTRYENAKNS